MTETVPTAAPSIRYDWRCAVVRDPRFTHAQLRVLLTLEQHANADGTKAHPGNERIASVLYAMNKRGELAPISTRTVQDALKRGRELGYIVQTAKRRRVGNSWHADEYRLALPADAAELLALGSPEVQTSGSGAGDHRKSNPSSPEVQTSGHQSLKHQTLSKDQKISPIAAASARDAAALDQKRRNGDKTAELYPLHPEWTPNNANESVADELGLDVEAVAEAFRRKATERGTRRRCWGKAFTRHLRDLAAGRVDDADELATVAADRAVEAAKRAAEVNARYADWTPAPAPAPLSATQTNETAPPVPEAPETAHEAPTADLEPVEAEVIEIAPSAGPGPAGYPPAVEAAIRDIEKRFTGPLSGPERVAAAALIEQGHPPFHISGEIDIMRDRARYAS